MNTTDLHLEIIESLRVAQGNHCLTRLAADNSPTGSIVVSENWKQTVTTWDRTRK